MREESGLELVDEGNEEAARSKTARTDDATSIAARELNHFDYFTEVEDFFVRRRGKTLLLSPMDWALIESWKQKGVPLHIALRGIERAFNSYDKRPPAGRRRSIKTLLYCEEEVEAQYAEWLESQTGKQTASATREETEAPNDLSLVNPFPPQIVIDHLMNRRDALAALRMTKQGGANLSLAFREALGRVEERLAELIADWETSARPSAERLEDALTQLERLLDENLRNCFTETELNGEEQHARQQLASYKARMEPTAYAATFTHLLMKSLRERRGVPRLSLFHL